MKKIFFLILFDFLVLLFMCSCFRINIHIYLSIYLLLPFNRRQLSHAIFRKKENDDDTLKTNYQLIKNEENIILCYDFENRKLLFNVYISNCLSCFVHICDSLIEIYRYRRLAMIIFTYKYQIVSLYCVERCRKKAIEVINCKLIWIPAGNKKKTITRNISWCQLRNFVFFLFLKEKKNMFQKISEEKKMFNQKRQVHRFHRFLLCF